MRFQEHKNLQVLSLLLLATDDLQRRKRNTLKGFDGIARSLFACNYQLLQFVALSH